MRDWAEGACTTCKMLDSVCTNVCIEVLKEYILLFYLEKETLILCILKYAWTSSCFISSAPSTGKKLKMVVFWVVAPCSDRPDDGGSKDLWNVGTTLPDYTVLQPRRQPSSYSPPWEPQILLRKEAVHTTVPERGPLTSKLFIYTCINSTKGRWRVADTFVSYSEGPGFKSRAGDRLSWLRF
jgi:hypothetical protein